MLAGRLKRRRVKFLWVFLGAGALLFALRTERVLAQETKVFSSAGFNGEELVSMALDPVSGTLFVGTGRALYRREDNIWKAVCGIEEGAFRVNKIVSAKNGEVFAATDKGLYAFGPKEGVCRGVLTPADEAEHDCVSVAVLQDETMFAGTRGGLFVKRPKQKEWVRPSAAFGSESVLSLWGEGTVLYAAVASGVFRTGDYGKKWEKIFDTVAAQTENGAEDEDAPEEVEEIEPIVGDITGIDSDPAVLYVAARRGIFKTSDAGKTWLPLPLLGLEPSRVRSIFAGGAPRRVFVALDTGVAELKDGRWQMLILAHGCRQAVYGAGKLYILTEKEIYAYTALPASADPAASSPERGGRESLGPFAVEPSVEDVQRMAIEYGELSDGKIRDWRRRANMKAFFPELSLDYDKTVTTALGATYDRVQVGPMDWGVSLKWDLSKLVYNPDQTSIDTRSKLMVQLRNDVLSEVTRLYFERRRLQIELLQRPRQGEADEFEKKLRLAELTALIDRLTGGRFSRTSGDTRRNF